MSVQVIDNFSYKGKKGNFERDNFDTLQAMRSYPEDGIDDGHVCFCNEDGNHYKFNHLNSVDGATGRWRLHNKSVNTLTETGEGKVLDARQGKILKDLIDAKVIEAGGVSFDTVPTKGSTNPVTSNGIKEAMDEQAESINSNMGVDGYPAFSESEAYSTGNIVNYNGKLYQFTSDHAAGAWTGTDADETDVVKAHIVQELGDSEDKTVSQKGVTKNLRIYNLSKLFPTDGLNNDYIYDIDKAVAITNSKLNIAVGDVIAFSVFGIDNNIRNYTKYYQFVGGNIQNTNAFIEINPFIRYNRYDLRVDNIFPTSIDINTGLWSNGHCLIIPLYERGIIKIYAQESNVIALIKTAYPQIHSEVFYYNNTVMSLASGEYKEIDISSVPNDIELYLCISVSPYNSENIYEGLPYSIELNGKEYINNTFKRFENLKQTIDILVNGKDFSDVDNAYKGEINASGAFGNNDDASVFRYNIIPLYGNGTITIIAGDKDETRYALLSKYFGDRKPIFYNGYTTYKTVPKGEQVSFNIENNKDSIIYLYISLGYLLDDNHYNNMPKQILFNGIDIFRYKGINSLKEDSETNKNDIAYLKEDSDIEFILPKKTLTFCKGKEYAFYKNALTNKSLNFTPSFLFSSSDTFTDYGRFIKYVPTDDGKDISIILSANGSNRIINGDVSWHHERRNIDPSLYRGKSVKILSFGDSYTEIGEWLDGIDELAKEDNVTIKWIGTMPTLVDNGVRSENQTGGTLYDCFMVNRENSEGLNKAGSTYKLSVSGITNRHMLVYYGNYVTYKDSSDSVWKIKGYKLDESGNGYIIITSNDYSLKSIENSGTLIKIGGEGDETIIYTSAISVNGNPLWNIETNEMDFNWYLSKFEMETPDIVLIQFCWNDIYSWYQNIADTTRDTFISNLQLFIDKIHTQLPNCSVIFSIEPMGSTDIWLNNDKDIIKYIRITLAKKLYELYEDIDYVDIVPSYIYVDGIWGIKRNDISVLQRYNETLPVPYGEQRSNGQDGVHCNTAGMKQISDAVYPYILRRISL